MSAPADRVRSIQRGCFTALRFVQHDKSEDVIPSVARNPVVDASLCSA